jgi:hypothetical protein
MFGKYDVFVSKLKARISAYRYFLVNEISIKVGFVTLVQAWPTKRENDAIKAV